MDLGSREVVAHLKTGVVCDPARVLILGLRPGSRLKPTIPTLNVNVLMRGIYPGSGDNQISGTEA